MDMMLYVMVVFCWLVGITYIIQGLIKCQAIHKDGKSVLWLEQYELLQGAVLVLVGLELLVANNLTAVQFTTAIGIARILATIVIGVAAIWLFARSRRYRPHRDGEDYSHIQKD